MSTQGDVLFEIDPVPFRLAAQQAKATLEQSQAPPTTTWSPTSRSTTRCSISTQQGVDLKQRDVDRKSTLVKSNFGSQLDLDNASTALVTAQRAARNSSSSSSPRAKTQLLGNPDLPLEQFPPYDQAKAALGPGRAQSRPHRDARADRAASRPRSTRSSSAASSSPARRCSASSTPPSPGSTPT